MSKKSKLKDPQEINLIGKFEGQSKRATTFFINKNQEKLLLNFCKILSTSYKNGIGKDFKFVKQF